jgi:hypothetical protein
VKNTVVLIAILLGGCSSQPRFVHHGGDPEQMFDNRTAQECWAGPVQKDNGSAARDESSKSYKDAVMKYEEAWAKDSEKCLRALDKYPNGIDPSGTRPIECSTTDDLRHFQSKMLDFYMIDIKRADRLREHPEEQKVIHVHGLPYCSELK